MQLYGLDWSEAKGERSHAAWSMIENITLEEKDEQQHQENVVVIVVIVAAAVVVSNSNTSSSDSMGKL